MSFLSFHGAVFFDVDGTLVPGTSSSAFLAGRLGHLRPLAAAEEGYAGGRLTNQEVSEIDARGWAGASAAEVRGWLAELPLVVGIDETIRWCRAQGLAPFLATLAWDPVGGYLTDRFDFEGFCGARLAVESGRYTGTVSRDFDEFGKRDYAAHQARRLGLARHRCAAVGDSRSDLPLFTDVGLSVAFNGDAAARRAAHAVVDAPDLRAIVPTLAAWAERL
ncbi:HAD family hydrolase [Embleya sp. NBC_00896]|uniref:HAD family hydrolase n=1 Tax=Embleya sp. NBC_00896 TaxID=2975961 RepID=UPI0038664318|nr:haloacid dehalogenase-like hydrolase [Embleya sp. NBC_00896]